VANFFTRPTPLGPNAGTRLVHNPFLTPTERFGPKAGTHPVQDPSHGFFLGGKTQNRSTSIHEPYFGVKNGACPVHVESWLFSGSRQLDDPIFLKSDEGLDKLHQNTANTQKWVNLYNEMLDDFKGRGTCMTMDSAYMGDIMGQIGQDVWKMNLLGTCQSN
jgi:hypothetical protein